MQQPAGVEDAASVSSDHSETTSCGKRMFRKKTTFILVVLVVLYAVLGGIIFHYLESDHELDVQKAVTADISTFLANSPCLNVSDVIYLNELFDQMFVGGLQIDSDGTLVNITRWDIKTSIFVAIELIVTVGYRPSAPKSVGGRVLAIIFAFLGIPLFTLMAIGIGRLLNMIVDGILRLLSHLRCCRRHLAPGGSDVIPWQSQIGRRRRYVYRTLGLAFGGAILLLFIPSIIFANIEEWTYAEAVYYSVTTFLTIGFGDLVPGYGKDVDQRYVGWYRLAVGCWLLLETGWFAAIVSSVRKAILAIARKTEGAVVAAVDELAAQEALPVPKMVVSQVGSKSQVNVIPSAKKKKKAKKVVTSSGDVSNLPVAPPRDKYGLRERGNNGVLMDSNALSYTSIVKIGSTS